jgi:hypothetical protein
MNGSVRRSSPTKRAPKKPLRIRPSSMKVCASIELERKARLIENMGHGANSRRTVVGDAQLLHVLSKLRSGNRFSSKTGQGP